MRLLDRYLLRELLTPLVYCLGGFFIFWVSFDLLDQLDDFHRRQMTGGEIAAYYLYGFPELLTLVLPVGFLLALLHCLTQHTRHHELTAMRAAGLSLWRICLPYLAAGLVLSAILHFMNEYWAGDAREHQEALLVRHATGGEGVWRSLDFQNRGDRRSWSLGGFHLVTAELQSPRVRLPMGSGGKHILEAGRLRWTNQAWRVLTGGTNIVRETVFRSAKDREPASRLISSSEFPRFSATPEDIRAWNHSILPVSQLRPLHITNWVEEIEEIFLTNHLVTIPWHTNMVLPEVLAGNPKGPRWQVQVFDPETLELHGVRVEMPLELSAQRLILADSGEWIGGGWVFHHAWDYLYRNGHDNDPLAVRRERMPMPELTETPAMLRSEARVGALHRGRTLRKPKLTAQEVRDYYHLHQDISPDLAAWLDTQLHARLAAPWTCMVVALIAIPFGAAGGRRNVFYGIAGSIALGFLFFVVQRFGFALGQAGQLHPWLAAWLPNALFALAGIVMIARVR